MYLYYVIYMYLILLLLPLCSDSVVWFYIWIGQVLDEGKLAEFDEPYLLLKNPETLFYKMAEQTGKSSAAKLLETARQAYEMRHEGSMDSVIELPRTDVVVVDGSDHREEESCDENEPLLIFESSV